MRVAVVGLGKVGLPLAVQYASRGLSVTGCDVDAAKVERINAGDCPVEGEEGLEDGLRSALEAGRLQATPDTATAVAASDVVVIIVPVGLTPAREPDFSHLDAALAAIARGIRPGTLVCVESTVPVGTTRGRAGGALPAGVLLAASPERVSSGRILRDLRAYPKIIGPLDDESWSEAEAFYGAALEAPCLVRVRDPETAEFAKLAEGVYRDVNIALASDLARYADRLGIDAAEAFAAANSQPYAATACPSIRTSCRRTSSWRAPRAA
jgi:nucleotide sugar dehydrogenase